MLDPRCSPAARRAGTLGLPTGPGTGCGAAAADAQTAAGEQLPSAAQSLLLQLLPDSAAPRRSAPGPSACKVDWEERRCVETDEANVFEMESAPDAWSVESQQLCLCGRG